MTLNLFKGIQIPGRLREEISHLQFADDVILFINSDQSSITGVKRILQCFQLLSGMKVNFSKSHVYGFHLQPSQISKWSSILGCQQGNTLFKYLGASIGSSPKKLSFWQPLLKKVDDKIKSYAAERLSIAGRLVLLKAAIDSVPIYWFSLYKIPTTICNLIEAKRRRFLWGEVENASRKLHLLSWERICSPKAEGGLGLYSIKSRNNVFLSKWWWRAYNERGSLWNNIMASRYSPSWTFDLDKVQVNQCSPIVKSILSIKLDPQCSLISKKENFR